MRKQGRIEIEVFVVLITMVFTSAVILFLVYSGTLEVKEEVSAEPVLNTEFLPLGREGFLAVKEFDFCGYVDEQYGCFDPKNSFSAGDEVHFRFVVESSPFNGQVALVENYRLKDPQGNVVLDIDESSNVYVDVVSNKNQESLSFRDYFVMHPTSPEGEYTLELVIENTLLQKKTTEVKKFILIAGEEE